MQTEIAQMICGFKLRQGKRTDTEKAWTDAMETAGRILALTDAKHKAPAEGAGEFRQALESVLNTSGARGTYKAMQYVDAVEQAEALLRARSSAPEAREEALGNLLAVIHGDGGHRALEVGVEQAAAEAEKIVAGLFAAPSADKLRIAVEALEPFANLGVSSGPDDEPCHYAYRITRGAIRNARQALAALKVEGA